MPTPKPAPGGSAATAPAPAPSGSSGGAARVAPAPGTAPGTNSAPQTAPADTGGAAGGAKSTIVGAVLLDQNGDGGVSRGDRPVVGLGVRLVGPISASVATAGDGSFAFSGLPAGTFTVSIGVPGGTVATGGASRVVTVDGRSGGRADFFLVRSDGAPASGMPTPVPPTPTAAPTATSKPLPTPIVAPGAPAPTASESGGRPGQGSGSTGPVARAAPGYRPSTGSSSSSSSSSGGQVAPRPLVNAPVRYAPGLTSPSNPRIMRTDRALWLGVPFITQLDGTLYGGVICGPASTAMVLGTFGIRTSPSAVRNYVNDMSGNYSADSGTSLDHLARVARESGLEVSSLYNPGGGGYLRWSTTLLRQQVEAGRPVVTLVKYRALPSHSGSLSDFDHYIVVAGLAGDDFVYNDAAFGGKRGYGLLISPSDLERAWDYSSIPRHGMAVGLTAESLAGRMARPEPAALAGQLDLGEELSDEMLLDEIDASLGNEVGFSGDYDTLTWRRVEVEEAPPEASHAEEVPAAAAAPRPEAAPQSGLDLSGFTGVESGPPVAGAPGQPRPLQPVATPGGQAGSGVPIPLLVLCLGLVAAVVGIAGRRLLE